MARQARIKAPLGQEGVYHLRAQIAGVEGDYPLLDKEDATELVLLMLRYARLYYCDVAGFGLMGDHWHDVCRFEAFRPLSRDTLTELAERFYPGAYRPHDRWTDADWERFNRRVFDVSEYMRNVNSQFARYYNRRHRRKGRFWADRFKCSMAGDDGYFRHLPLYAELNPVRAHLVERPEDWPFSSARLRFTGQDQDLMPLTELFATPDYETAVRTYRELLLWTGTQPNKEGAGTVPEAVFREEQEGRFLTPGLFLRRHRCLSDGLVIGTREAVQEWLDPLIEQAVYQRRRHPIPASIPGCYTLREQRGGQPI